MNPTLSAKLHEILKQHGSSITQPRLTVFQALLNTEPLTMAQLYQKTKQTLDRATLYRTVDLFEKAHIVHRITIGWKYKIELSDNFTKHHHHLTCIQCGKVITLDHDTQLEKLVAATTNQHGFVPTRHTIEIEGRCSTCQQKSSQ